MSQDKDPTLCIREGCGAPKAILADICRRHQEADKVQRWFPTEAPQPQDQGSSALAAIAELKTILRPDAKIGEDLDTDDLISMVERARLVVSKFP